MLEITRQADYALRAVTEVARLTDGDRIPTAVIAERQKIPLPFLAKIVSQLSVQGVLEATRGAGGWRTYFDADLGQVGVPPVFVGVPRN